MSKVITLGSMDVLAIVQTRPRRVFRYFERDSIRTMNT